MVSRLSEVVEEVVMPATLAWSAGAIISTAPDMVRFLRGAVGGEVFDDAATARSWREDNVVLLFGSIPYSRGLMTLGTGCYGHPGQSFGSQFVACYDVDSDVAIVGAVGDSQVGHMIEFVQDLLETTR